MRGARVHIVDYLLILRTPFRTAALRCVVRGSCPGVVHVCLSAKLGRRHVGSLRDQFPQARSRFEL